MSKIECVRNAKSCNHQAIEFRKKGKTSVVKHFTQQRDMFMRWARTAY